MEDNKILNIYRDFLDDSKKEYDAKGYKQLERSIVTIQEFWQEKGDIPEELTTKSIGLGTLTMKELGLDPLGVSVSVLLPFIENDENFINTLEHNDRAVMILNELLKIKDLNTKTAPQQSENMRNLILSLASDFRVILIKIAERLLQLRSLKKSSEEESFLAAAEIKEIYSPLAHRLGLYNVMSEMEDTSMSILEKEVYFDIAGKLQATKDKRQKFIKEFIEPIQEKLEEEKLKCEILGRPKAISSIWRKMSKQNVEFEEVYDKFAIRIIVESKASKEKSDCWRAYSVVTDFYQPNPNRLRDWISVPKSNGYESLHTTVVIPGGEWVEVQIRTRRMNEIAEKGLAAHWKYKGIKGQAGIDEWLGKVREALENAEKEETSSVIDDLKLSQFNKEIFVFTPNGDLKKFPENATVLDFAYDIHTAVGSSCKGARINGKNVPIRHTLNNGDKVEIISAKNQKAKVDWLNFVVTSKAKNKIKQSLKDDKLKEAELGKEILKRRFKNWKIEYDDSNIRKVINHFKYKDSIDLHFDIALEKIDLLDIKELFAEKAEAVASKAIPIEDEKVERLLYNSVQESNDFLIIDENIANIDYKLAKCCSPIHGDSVFGFVTRTAGISIHRVNCPNARQLMTRYGYRVVKASWTQATEDTRFAVTIIITGLDDIGIVSNISDVISKDLQVNMRSIAIDSNDGMFEGTITLFVKDTKHLEALIKKLKRVKGVSTIRRTA